MLTILPHNLGITVRSKNKWNLRKVGVAEVKVLEVIKCRRVYICTRVYMIIVIVCCHMIF